MGSEYEQRRPDQAPEEPDESATDAPLSDEDIETEQNERAELRARYDGDGSKDLSIDDD
jgi:hypothetical protein